MAVREGGGGGGEGTGSQPSTHQSPPIPPYKPWHLEKITLTFQRYYFEPRVKKIDSQEYLEVLLNQDMLL